MKISHIYKKYKKKIIRFTFIAASILSYIIIVQLFSVFVDTMTTIFMYLSSLSILLGLFIISKLKKSFSKKIKDLENFKNLDDNLKIKTISTTVDSLLKNETSWIEFYESQIHQFIRIKSKTSFYIIIKILLFISLSIIVILFITSFSIVSVEISLIISNIISLLQYIFIIPLIVTDLYINSGKTVYRYAKKSLNYIKKRNRLIYHNSKLIFGNNESFKAQLNIFNDRVDDFNKILTPFSNYIKEFELITILGIFINILLIVNIEIFYIPFIYIGALYLIYIREQVKTNHKIRRTELYKQIESDLDTLAFSN